VVAIRPRGFDAVYYSATMNIQQPGFFIFSSHN